MILIKNGRVIDLKVKEMRILTIIKENKIYK